jgi:hypothetical protein
MRPNKNLLALGCAMSNPRRSFATVTIGIEKEPVVTFIGWVQKAACMDLLTALPDERCPALPHRPAAFSIRPASVQ